MAKFVEIHHLHFDVGIDRSDVRGDTGTVSGLYDSTGTPNTEYEVIHYREEERKIPSTYSSQRKRTHAQLSYNTLEDTLEEAARDRDVKFKFVTHILPLSYTLNKNIHKVVSYTKEHNISSISSSAVGTNDISRRDYFNFLTNLSKKVPDIAIFASSGNEGKSYGFRKDPKIPDNLFLVGSPTEHSTIIQDENFVFGPEGPTIKNRSSESEYTGTSFSSPRWGALAGIAAMAISQFNLKTSNDYIRNLAIRTALKLRNDHYNLETYGRDKNLTAMDFQRKAVDTSIELLIEDTGGVSKVEPLPLDYNTNTDNLFLGGLNGTNNQSVQRFSN